MGVLGGLAALLSVANPISAIAALIGGGVFVGSNIINLFMRSDSLRDQHIRVLCKRRREFDEQLIQALRDDCESAAWDQGVKEADDLWAAYENLVRLCDENASYDDPEASQYRSMAETLYQAGEFNLRRALELYKTLEVRTEESLVDEIAELKRQRRSSRTGTRERLDAQVTELEGQLAKRQETEQKFQDRLTRTNTTEGILHSCASLLSDVGIGDAANKVIDWHTAARTLKEAVDSTVGGDEELRRMIANA